jgi:zinc and cadmium transporter
LLGVLVFFLLEKLVLWRHCHTTDCDRHAPGGHGRRSAAGHLILIGDAIHNIVDGVLIASAFFVDVQLGMVTALAVLAHELPQELGDFAILLHSGFTRRKALVYNLLVSLGTVVGGVAGYLFLSTVGHLVPYVLAVAASSFIYIAVADLIPDLHRRVDARATVQQLALILAGIGVIFGVDALLH